MTTFIPSRKQSLLVALVLTFVLSDQAFARNLDVKNNLHVLAAGVNLPTYHPEKDKLRSAAKDATDHVKFWNSTRGKLFVGVDAPPALTNEGATCNAIVQSMQQLTAKAQPGDTAAIVLSGHGGVNRQGEFQFDAYDRPLLFSEIRPMIEMLARKGVRILLIVDTCHSGGIGIQGDNIIVLASSTAEQTSLDGPDNGIFTKALLEGLNGAADENKDGVVTLAEVVAYVSKRMEQLEVDQSPTCGGCPPNIRSNLPLAVIGAAPTVNPNPSIGSAEHGTGPLTGYTGPLK